MSPSVLGSDGKVYCRHMEEAVKRKSTTSRHPNRSEFYCCKRPTADKSKCKFFVWADELPSEQGTIHTSSSNSSRPVISPARQASVEGVGFVTRSMSVPRTRPLQEHSSPPPSNPPATPRSSNRHEAIQAGLRQREQDLSPTRQPGPSQELRPAIPEFPGARTIPQPPSPVPTEPDCEAEAPRVMSFLGLYDSPEPVEVTIKDEGRPSTPKKRRLTPPTGGTIKGTAGQPATPSGAGALITPPKTMRRDAGFDVDGRGSDMVRSRKGKGRESAQSAPSDWDEDGSGPSRTEEADALPQFEPPEDTSTTASASPTVAENVLDYNGGVKTRVKALAEYLDSFDITQAGRSLQAIERQKAQYEYKDQFQKARIEELAAENDRLTAEVTRLREALQRGLHTTAE